MIKVKNFKGKDYKLNCSSIIGVYFNNNHQKNIFDVFKKFMEVVDVLNKKGTPKEDLFLKIDSNIFQDTINIAYLMVKHGNNGILKEEDFYNNFEYMELIEFSLMAVSEMINTTKKVPKQEVGFKSHKKKKKKGR